MEEFSEWLQDELNKRGWSRSEASRRGGVSASMFDKVINGYANPGPDFCTGVARAFEMPTEAVFRKAGLLPTMPQSPLDDLNMTALYDILKNLPPKERREVLEYAKFRYNIVYENREKYAV